MNRSALSLVCGRYTLVNFGQYPVRGTLARTALEWNDMPLSLSARLKLTLMRVKYGAERLGADLGSGHTRVKAWRLWPSIVTKGSPSQCFAQARCDRG